MAIKDVSTNQVSISVVGTVMGMPRPIRAELNGFTDADDVLKLDQPETMDVKLTADGKLLRFGKPGTVDLTINLSMASDQNWAFSQVLQEQAGYGKLYLATTWEIAILYPGFSVVASNGTLISGNLLPDIQYERLSNISYVFRFSNSMIKAIPL